MTPNDPRSRVYCPLFRLPFGFDRQEVIGFASRDENTRLDLERKRHLKLTVFARDKACRGAVQNLGYPETTDERHAGPKDKILLRWACKDTTRLSLCYEARAVIV